jgi:hypothetical protein
LPPVNPHQNRLVQFPLASGFNKGTYLLSRDGDSQALDILSLLLPVVLRVSRKVGDYLLCESFLYDVDSRMLVGSIPIDILRCTSSVPTNQRISSDEDVAYSCEKVDSF